MFCSGTEGFFFLRRITFAISIGNNMRTAIMIIRLMRPHISIRCTFSIRFYGSYAVNNS